MGEEVPNWLNKEFLQSVLENEVKGTEITIKEYDVQPAIPRGEHYGSCLHRVIVEYSFKKGSNVSTGTIHLIVKSLPTGELMRHMIAEVGTFKREAEVYLTILPEMYKLASEISGRQVPRLACKCLSAPPDILVFEDLTTLGYRMADRRSGLDFSHCKLALKSLAQFHAMSVALHKKDPSCMANMTEAFYKEERRPILEMFIAPQLQVLAATVENWPGYERFGDKIRNVAECGVDKIIDVVKPKDGSLSVLNHGDFWVNNILFRYSHDTNCVQEAVFVDFQISRFSCPALDLQYFFYTSPSEEVRFKHMDELLEFYHAELRNMLDTLNCGHIQFTLQQLKKEFEERAFFGLITSFTLLNLVLADPKNAIDINQMSESLFKSAEEQLIATGYSNPLFQENFKKFLLHFESKNLL